MATVPLTRLAAAGDVSATVGSVVSAGAVRSCRAIQSRAFAPPTLASMMPRSGSPSSSQSRTTRNFGFGVSASGGFATNAPLSLPQKIQIHRRRHGSRVDEAAGHRSARLVRHHLHERTVALAFEDPEALSGAADDGEIDAAVAVEIGGLYGDRVVAGEQARRGVRQIWSCEDADAWPRPARGICGRRSHHRLSDRDVNRAVAVEVASR